MQFHNHNMFTHTQIHKRKHVDYKTGSFKELKHSKKDIKALLWLQKATPLVLVFSNSLQFHHLLYIH